MSLTDIECKKAQAQEKIYRISDGNGLSLMVNSNGSKYWTLRFTVNGQRKTITLGQYPELSLKKARELTFEYKHQTKQNKILMSLNLHFVK